MFAVRPVLLALLLFSTAFSVHAAEPPLTVHEWGTFTVLQDESGEELAGINTDDEPVPLFVHDLAPELLSKPLLTNRHWQFRSKGAPQHHPAVTMRLETPVIYFYPAAGKPLPHTVNVEVAFRGGWLTQFYPAAEFSAPEYKNKAFDFSVLTSKTLGRLQWRDLQVDDGGGVPLTDDPVWLTPRKVRATGVTSREGESEKYLFYRGVGRQRAPLKITMNRQRKQISVQGNFADVLTGESKVKIGDLWLVQVSQRGNCRYRRLDPIEVDRREGDVRLTTSAAFEPASAEVDQKRELDAEMHDALVKDGLFADEATALLNTWQRSYFATPGLRVFYLVPRVWTDHYLPLTITDNPPLVRSMVGRIELIGDEQRELLTKLEQVAVSDGNWVNQIPASPAKDRLLAGRSDFGDLGVRIPDDYGHYLALGRFRNALVTAEAARTRSKNIQQFINRNGLELFQPRSVMKAETAAD